MTGAAVGETLRSFESADAAADSAAAERGDEVRAALVGAEVDGNRYSLIAADGMVEAEVVVAKRDGQWTLLSFDTCVEAGPFADLPPLDVTIEESVERFNEYPTGSGLKDLTAGRLAEGVFGNPVTDRMTALQLGPSASSRSRAFVLVVALDEENRFTMVDDVWVNALYAASSMSLAEAGDLFVSQLELELERASAAATREVTLNSEITGHLGFNPAQRSIVLALVPAGAPPPDNLPALGDHVP